MKTKIETILLFVCLLCLIAATGKAQVFVNGGAGMTNKYFSGELQLGVKVKSNISLTSDEFDIKILPKNATLSVGYISLQLASDQPALFNVRAGYLLNENWHVFGGFVRVMQSLDNKALNSNAWQAGFQYHFVFYDRGTIYTGATYTTNKMVSVSLGMSFNLIDLNN